MDPLKKVRPGERFRPKAEAWNAFIDAARYVKDRVLNQGGEARNIEIDTILVRNLSDYDIPQYGVLWVVGTPWRGIVQVQRPGHPFLSGLVIAAEPIGRGAVGHAWNDGYRPMRIRDWDTLQVADFPLLAISQANSFDAQAWDGTGMIPVLGKLDESPLVLADLTNRSH